jgi:tetrahydrodipicolinate N-succinyltransferase
MQPIILPYRGILPRIAADAFVAPGAVIVGDVEIAAGASIWFGCVLRGDVAAIVVGAGSNVQDGTVVHGSTGKPPTWIGAKVTIGHMALIHACRLEDGSFVGMKACVSDGANRRRRRHGRRRRLGDAGKTRAPRRAVGRQPGVLHARARRHGARLRHRAARPLCRIGGRSSGGLTTLPIL